MSNSILPYSNPTPPTPNTDPSTNGHKRINKARKSRREREQNKGTGSEAKKQRGSKLVAICLVWSRTSTSTSTMMVPVSILHCHYPMSSPFFILEQSSLSPLKFFHAYLLTVSLLRYRMLLSRIGIQHTYQQITSANFNTSCTTPPATHIVASSTASLNLAKGKGNKKEQACHSPAPYSSDIASSAVQDCQELMSREQH